MPGLGILVMGLALVVGLIAGRYEHRRRRERYEAIARSIGFTHREGDPFGIVASDPGFTLFRQGHSRRIRHTLSGTLAGRPALLFDYYYVTGSGKNRRTHKRSGVQLELPIRGPHLLIRPEGMFDRMAGLLGIDDIDLESDEFNRRFHVSCDDKKFAYDICHNRLMEWLLVHDGHCWELLGDRLIFHSRSFDDFDEVEARLSISLVEQFVGLLPDYLTAERSR